MRVAIAAMRSISSLLLALFLAGCASNATRIETLAGTLGLSRSVVEAGGFRTLLYMRDGGPADAPLLIFLEGDGVPWRGGTEPNLDPTTGNPLALKLLGQTSGPAAYVSRPCYQEMTGAGCTPELWTMQRYSEAVVSNMTVTVRTAAARANVHRVVLVGYSGGGVLAVLVAERLDNVAAVVTIGANLDLDAWTQHHGYLPLTGSLNPAVSAAAHPWPETHLYGARDSVVPIATTAAYFARFPRAQRKVMDDYDHVCCWVEHWPALWQQIRSAP
jgi:pimeloyl-ACP methyl ester carboxylesterase